MVLVPGNISFLMFPSSHFLEGLTFSILVLEHWFSNLAVHLHYLESVKIIRILLQCPDLPNQSIWAWALEFSIFYKPL